MDDILYKLGIELSMSAPGMGSVVGLALSQLALLQNAAGATESAVARAAAAQTALARSAQVAADARTAAENAAVNTRATPRAQRPINLLTGKPETPAFAASEA